MNCIRIKAERRKTCLSPPTVLLLSVPGQVPLRFVDLVFLSRCSCNSKLVRRYGKDVVSDCGLPLYHRIYMSQRMGKPTIRPV